MKTARWVIVLLLLGGAAFMFLSAFAREASTTLRVIGWLAAGVCFAAAAATALVAVARR